MIGGPLQLLPRLTAVAYLQFINKHLPNLLDGIFIATRGDIWYFQDGVLAYNA